MDTQKPSENPYASPGAALPSAKSSDFDDEIFCEGTAQEWELLHGGLVIFRRVFIRISRMFLVVATVPLSFAAMSRPLLGYFSWDSLAIGVVTLSAPVLFMAWIVWRFRKSIRESPPQEPVRTRITSRVIEITTQTGRGEIAWENLGGFAESKYVVMIGCTRENKIHYPFYRSHFAPPDWEQFRNLVHSKLQKL